MASAARRKRPPGAMCYLKTWLQVERFGIYLFIYLFNTFGASSTYKIPGKSCDKIISNSTAITHITRNSSADEIANVNFLRRRRIRTTKYKKEHWLDLHRVSKKTSTHIIGYKLRNSCPILIIFDIKIPHII